MPFFPVSPSGGDHAATVKGDAFADQGTDDGFAIKVLQRDWVALSYISLFER